MWLDSLVVESIPFALSEIPIEINNLSNHLIEISKVIQADENIIKNDSIVRESSEILEISKQEIIATLFSMTYQRLENLIRAWHNYKSKFDVIQETLKKRINRIETVKNELGEELHKWEMPNSCQLFDVH